MSFRAYPEYRDVNSDWIGEVPSHWEISPLKRLVELIVEPAENPPYQVGLEHIEGWSGNLIGTTKKFEGDGISFRADDVLFGKLRPYLAKVHLAKAVGAAVGDFFVLRPTRIDPTYLHKYILNPAVIRQLDASTIGAKMPRVSWGDMALLPVVAPAEDEQRNIAAFLDHETAKIDALVAEQKRLIELLKEKRQAVISHAVTKGLNPNVPMKDSGRELGAIPAHWKLTKLKHLVGVTGGSTPSKDRLDYWDGDVPWASPRDMKTDSLVDTFHHITDTAMSECGNQLVSENTILVIVRGMILAHSFPVSVTATPMTINQDLKALTPLPDVDKAYLACLLAGIKLEVFRYVDSSAHGTKKLEWERFINIDLSLPPFAEQRAIAAWIDTQKANLNNLEIECETLIERLAERRSALISAAVTGKIDVRDWQPPKSTEKNSREATERL